MKLRRTLVKTKARTRQLDHTFFFNSVHLSLLTMRYQRRIDFLVLYFCFSKVRSFLVQFLKDSVFGEILVLDFLLFQVFLDPSTNSKN
jgi:hypothetical protein